MFIPSGFLYIASGVCLLMLVWLTIEVGRNDATNIVNAVFGARVLRRKRAVQIAGIAVIFGAWASSPVMETARKGIFDPALLSVNDALTIYLSVYLTNTVLMYSFSAFGMPISSTACLVFSLLGGGLALGGIEVIHWNKSWEVILAIVFSIFISGAFGFLIQRAFRGAIGKDCDDPEKIRLHGPWIAGALLTGLVYFILMKGMEDISFIQLIRNHSIDVMGAPTVLLCVWSLMALLVWIVMRFTGDWIYKNLFAVLAVIGMLAIAIAFGQNDLANCASPGIASLMILEQGSVNAHVAHEYPVRSEQLLFCGALLALGMMTRTAQRVTRAAVNTGSQGDVVRLYAPQWCLWLAKRFLPKTQPNLALAPEPELGEKKTHHYDALRAAVITSVSGSVIAFASGMGLPVSTTYVAFAAVISTGWADRIFLRGDAQLKLGRTIWVVFCWFFSAVLAGAGTGLCAKFINLTGVAGIALILAIDPIVISYMKRRADKQDKRLQWEALERRKRLTIPVSNSQPLLFTTEDMGDMEESEDPIFIELADEEIRLQ